MDVDDAAAFGDSLRSARERRQISLELVSHRTKIAARLLAALERGDVSGWPPGMYRRAMMRAYANAIGLDGDHALQKFGRVFEPAVPPVDTRGAATPAPRPREAGSWLHEAALLVAAATVVAVVVAAVAAVVRRDPEQTGSLPVVHARIIEAGPPQPLTPVAPAALPLASPAEKPAVPEDEEATEGRLTIDSEPSGAVVMVNGIRRGTTPLTVADLPFGDKRVRLILDGYVSAERVAALGPARATATIQVTLQPRDAVPSADRGSRTADRGSADRH